MPAEEYGQFVCFQLDDQGFALCLESVERALRVVDITPVPDAPPSVLGVIDVEGDVVPVLDLRDRFGMRARDLSTSDQLVIARTTERIVALLVDSVDGILRGSVEGLDSDGAASIHPEFVAGVIRHNGRMILVLDDLEKLISSGPEDNGRE